MRALLLGLLVIVPSLAGEETSLQKAVRLFRSTDAAAREQGSRRADHVLRELLAPLLQALEDKDPEVRRRARRAILGLVPGELEKEKEAQTAVATRQVILARLPWRVRPTPQEILKFVNAEQMLLRVRRTEAGARLRKFGIEVRVVVPRGQVRGGLHVRRVHEKTKAAGFGLRVGDHILAVNGKRVTTFEELHGALGKKPAWDKVKFRVLRAGRQINLPVVR